VRRVLRSGRNELITPQRELYEKSSSLALSTSLRGSCDKHLSCDATHVTYSDM
jgi:hypothetical protein